MSRTNHNYSVHEADRDMHPVAGEMTMDPTPPLDIWLLLEREGRKATDATPSPRASSPHIDRF